MRSVEPHLATWRAIAIGLAGALVVGCGASTERRTATLEPAQVAPASEASRARARASTPGTAPTVEVAAESALASGERARGRRGADAAAQTLEQVAFDAPVPEAVLAAHGRALAAVRAQDWIEAELRFEQLVLEHPAYPGPYVNLALVYLRDGRTADASAMLDRALAIAPDHAAANTQLGILRRGEGRFADAEAAYRRALESEPAHALAHYNFGVLLDVYLHRPAEALEHYERYQESLATPDATVGRWIVDLRRRLGIAAGTPSVAQEDRP